MWQEPRVSSRVSIGETGLLSRCPGKVGIPLELRQGNRPLTPDEVGNTGPFSSSGRKLGLLSSDDVSLLEHLELHKGSIGMELRIALEALQGKRASSRIEGGISWFFSRSSEILGILLKLRWYLREPCVLPLGSQTSFQVSRGLSGFPRRSCIGIRPHFALRWNVVVFLKLQQEAWGYSRVMEGTSGNLICWLWEVRTPFKF